ncbi:MAG: hypothetical protein LUD19_03515 [Clostridia bacterium]|nr:hypothetical protein [Clostridia bacterium]
MQKLENLEITKVAFVPEGDNKKADVLLFKSKPADGAGDGQTDPAIEATPAEANTMKRVLLAIGKALGFEKAESTEDNGTPPADNNPQGDNNDAADDDKPADETKKGVEDMKIDKSKLTAEELAQLEAIEKKAGVAEDNNDNAGDNVNKGGKPAENTPKDEPAGDDIYKGLHPAVAAELKELRKRADAAEEREMLSVAKKYELLGKKPEELSKTLKSLKDAGGTAYDDMIGVLDASLAAVEKSGAFNEVGKGGSGTPDAWAQIEKHADEILKAAPTLTRTQAIEKACDQHPELVAEYEKNR